MVDTRSTRIFQEVHSPDHETTRAVRSVKVKALDWTRKEMQKKEHEKKRDGRRKEKF